jgi:putative PIG3 family NAD(P)H quinone oxidoreductase
MRALTIAAGQLEVTDRPIPAPGPGDVLVRVHGAGLNRADLLQRAGGYPAPPGAPADIPGLEFAGTVAAIGEGVETRAVGDAVFGIVGGGAQAEYLTVAAEHCAPVPPALDLVAAGGVPEVFITAHDAMVTQAGTRAGEWMLVHAVGSGVGTAALQLARELDVHVVGTARTADKIERCRALGLDAGIVPVLGVDGALDTDALAWAVVEATGAGADVTLDLAGGAYLTANIAAAAPRGRIVCIGTIAGARASIPVVAILAKRLHVIGTVLRARDRAEKAAATDAFVRDVVPLLAERRIEPIVETVVPLDRAADAYELLASDRTFGKVVLDCG